MASVAQVEDEMAKDFDEDFKDQIAVLTKLQQAVQGAIERAIQNRDRIKAGEPVEKVFVPVRPKQQNPAAQGGGS
jgi:hypothetical protein